MKITKINSEIGQRFIVGSLPDIDIDFEGERRNDVKHYLEEKYGQNQVCSVGTYATLKIKNIIKDIAKIYGASIEDVEYISKIINPDWKFKDIIKASCESERLKNFINQNPESINAIGKLLGQIRSTSIHACATLIVPKEKEIQEFIPIKKMALKDGEYMLVSEWEGGELEQAGFLKEDILGIDQLNKFRGIINFVKDHYNKKIDFYNIPYDDKKVFKYFTRGWNSDVFQFGTLGLSDYCRKVKPESIHDLVAINALYRPGAMENNYHNIYVKRKNGEEEIESFVGAEKILGETYGIFCIRKGSFVNTIKKGKKIEDVLIDDLVLTEDGTYQKVVLNKRNGIKNIKKLRTSFGRELFLTEDHKVLTQNGWKQVKDLKSEDLVKGFFEEKEKVKVGSDKDWCLGLYLADGTSNKSTPNIACSSEDFANKVCAVFNKEFNLVSYSKKYGRCWYACLSAKRGHNGSFCRNHKPNEFIKYLKDLKLFGKTKDGKVLPKDATLMTLAGFIEGDGCLFNRTIRLKNRQLAIDIYKLFQSYRIHSSYYENDAYSVSFSDIKGLIKYKIKDDKMKSYGGVLPVNYLSYINLSLRSIGNRKNIRRAIKNNSYCFEHTLGDTDLRGKHVTWGKVLQIYDAGKDEVFDLSIDKNHSFVVGGLVVHNCFQEQVMKLCQVLGGINEEDSDIVRKALGKKKIDILIKFKKQFIEHYVSEFKVTEEYAEEVWEAIEKSSGYNFNKSHSASYSEMGYKSQWLKVHYPLAFWVTAFKHLPTDKKKRDPKIAQYINETNESKIVSVNAPNINFISEDLQVNVKENKIYWEISSVRMLGIKAMAQLKESSLEYFSFREFLIENVKKGSKINKSHIENLVTCGAFDEIEDIKHPKDRLKLINFYREEYKVKIDKKKDIFTLYSEKTNFNWWWSLQQKKLCGYAIFDNEAIVSYYTPEMIYYSFYSLMKMKKTKNISVVGVVKEVKIRKSNGKDFGIISIDNNFNEVTIKVWNKEWESVSDLLKDSEGSILICTGDIAKDTFSGKNAVTLSANSEIEILN